MSAAPPFVGIATAGGATAANVTCNVPAGTKDGMVMIAVLSKDATDAVTLPSGWTLLVEDTVDTFHLNIATRRASSEPANYTWTFASTWRDIAIATYVATSVSGGFLDPDPPAAVTTGSSINSIATNANTTATTDTRVVAIHTSKTLSTWSAPPGSYVARNAGTAECHIMDVAQAAAGSTGTVTQAWTGPPGAGKGYLFELVSRQTIDCWSPAAGDVDSANVASYVGPTFTPEPNSFLVAMVFATGTAAAAPTMTDGSLTWTRQQRIVYNTTDLACLFTAPVGASPVSISPTFDCTGDNATGCVILIFEFVNYLSLRQTDSEARTGANPVITPASALLTANAYCAGFAMPRNPPVSAPPTSWFETDDTGYTVPANGAAGAFRVTGDTGTTITFTSASAAYGILMAEINTAVAAATKAMPIFRRPRRIVARRK